MSAVDKQGRFPVRFVSETLARMACINGAVKSELGGFLVSNNTDIYRN